MLEDTLLIWKLKRGHTDASLRIYEKYKKDLLTLATAFCRDKHAAEDIVHSIFVAFVRNIDQFELRGKLKSYLAICVVNRARNLHKDKLRSHVSLDEAAAVVSDEPGPDQAAMYREQVNSLLEAMEQIPYEQSEVIMLHLKGEMRFREIAELLDISINTVQSRYRYGLEKLRDLLNGDLKE